jgi:hypothetical protein
MEWLRSKELRTQIQSVQQWVQSSRTSRYQFHFPSPVHVPESIWNDVPVATWLKQYLPLQSQIDLATALIQAPVTHIPQLQQRQAILKTFRGPQKPLLDTAIEADVNWFLSTPAIDKNYLFKTLFPGAWYLRWVKLHPELLLLYQLYAVYFTTASSFVYPFSMILGPYWLLRYKLGFPLTLRGYFEMVCNLVGLFKNNLKQLLGIGTYIGFYLYSLLQNIDLTIQLHQLRNVLAQKVKTVYTLVQRVKRLSKQAWWKPFEDFSLPPLEIKPTLFWVYKLLTQPDLQTRLFAYFKVAVLHDTLLHLAKVPYALLDYGPTTYFHHLCNPLLDNTQVPNPLSLRRSLIVSGPNAGGKTTYIKSLLWAILLGQSFGIAYCSSGCLKPYDAILHHHRVHDIVGDQSLFQAEMAKIKEAIQCVANYTSVIYFMDEPLHSTHPIDGAAMLKALLYYLGTHSNCSVVITSHYFSIQSVPGYQNVSVRAYLQDTTIRFDYLIYPGGSKQTIGIELLRRADFPAAMLESAVKLKNKIYAGSVNV